MDFRFARLVTNLGWFKVDLPCADLLNVPNFTQPLFQVKQNLLQKSRIKEKKNVLTNADSSTDTKKILLVRQNSPKNYLFCAWRFYTPMSKKIQIWDNFFPLLSPKDSENLKKFGHWTSGSGGKNTFEQSKQIKKNLVKKKFRRRDFATFIFSDIWWFLTIFGNLWRSFGILCSL